MGLKPFTVARRRRQFFGGDTQQEMEALAAAAAAGVTFSDIVEARRVLVGEELGYAELAVDDATNNVDFTAGGLMANLIPGLAVTVTGKGRPVEVQFQSHVRHSTANAAVSAVLMVNGAIARWWTASSPSTSGSTGLRLMHGVHRMVLTDEVEYVFEVGKQLGAAGTGTFHAAAERSTLLAVTQR